MNLRMVEWMMWMGVINGGTKAERVCQELSVRWDEVRIHKVTLCEQSVWLILYQCPVITLVCWAGARITDT